jgi:hypothetical protein
MCAWRREQYCLMQAYWSRTTRLFILNLADANLPDVSRILTFDWNCHNWAYTVFRRVRKIAISDCWIHRVCPSVWKNSAPTERIFMKFDIWVFFRKSVENSSFINMIRITGTSHEDRYTILVIFSLFLLIMINVSDRLLQKIKTYFISNNFFLSKIVPSMR